MKEMYALRTLDGYDFLTVQEANQKYGKAEFPYHEDFDDDLCAALQCEKCGTIFEYDPNYTDCPNCEHNSKNEQTGTPIHVFLKGF